MIRRREFITLLGGAAACPTAARAQQPAMPVVGFISSRGLGDSADVLAAFHQGLNEAGYVEGRNVAIEYRWADGQYDRLPALAADLVRRQVKVIVSAGGDPTARAAKAATTTTPIVFVTGGDPIKVGLVTSLNRPEGNITGVHIFLVSLGAKLLGLLHDLVPKAGLVAVLVNPNFAAGEAELQEVQKAAHSLKLQVHALRAGTEHDLDSAFAILVREGAHPVLVGADPFFNSRRGQIVALAARYAVPAIYAQRGYTSVGGLMSYGPSLTDGYRQTGDYTAKILKGAKPADLPVIQPTKLELVINLKTATTLGLEVPSTLLAIADEVIE
jgi:putative ABC transport system substrate-binding protein